MSFPESVKLEAKRRSAFRCVVCQKPFVQVHHIIPQHDGRSDDLSNAAPLCAGCHDLYGENPSKRKQIREMRDYWFDYVRRRMNGDLEAMPAPLCPGVSPNGAIALYHFVYAHEDFDITAKILMNLISNAQKKHPGKPRHLYIDIEGHRNAEGGFDQDMFELQTNFMIEFLLEYLTEVHMPLASLKNTENQVNRIPNKLAIVSDI